MDTKMDTVEAEYHETRRSFHVPGEVGPKTLAAAKLFFGKQAVQFTPEQINRALADVDFWNKYCAKTGDWQPLSAKPRTKEQKLEWTRIWWESQHTTDEKPKEENLDNLLISKLRSTFVTDFNFDPNDIMRVFETRKRHNELNAMAPEMWGAIHRVNERRALHCMALEAITLLEDQNSRNKDWNNARLETVLGCIERIIEKELLGRASKTVEMIHAFLAAQKK